VDAGKGSRGLSAGLQPVKVDDGAKRPGKSKQFDKKLAQFCCNDWDNCTPVGAISLFFLIYGVACPRDIKRGRGATTVWLVSSLQLVGWGESRPVGLG
jgi:hypothetical protein